MKRTYVNPTSSKVVFVNHNLIQQSPMQQRNALEIQIDKSSLDDDWGCAKTFHVDKTFEEEQMDDYNLW